MRRFINYSLGLLLAGITLFFACRPSEMIPGYVLIGRNETVNLRSEITVRADSILDNRCPEGWNCLVAGFTSVRILLTQNNTSVATRLTSMPLYVPGKGYVRQDSTVVELRDKKVTIILRDIIPHRTSSAPNPRDQKAMVQISFQ